VIEARGLAKRFGQRLALGGLDVEADPGDVLGLIGPNGAGKSTTIRILSTLLAPDAGRATVAGCDVVQEAQRLRGLIGYMPERFGLYDELTVEQYLDVFARVFGFHGRARKRQVEGVLELTELRAKRKDPCEGLSKGVRQRVFLAKTLLHDPSVLLLDEPASGLDPQARIDLRTLLGVLRAQGKTILFASHILSELERICNRVAVVEGGRVRFAGTLEDVTRRMARGQRIRLRVLNPAAAAQAVEALETIGAQGDHAISSLDPSDREVTFHFDGETEDVPGLHRALVEAGVPVFAFEVEAQNLESLFLEVTQGLVT
jgi:ABC-2 type transport system ATP-binding protein